MREGTAILFVSHDLPAVEGIAERALWLDEGRVRGLGRADAITARYRESLEATTP